MHIEYIVGVLLPVTLKLSSTTRNLPNPPTGARIALTSPPTLPPVKPAFHSGTEGADIAAAAPRHWRVICAWSEVAASQVEPTLTVGMARPTYEYTKTRQLKFQRLDRSDL